MAGGDAYEVSCSLLLHSNYEGVLGQLLGRLADVGTAVDRTGTRFTQFRNIAVAAFAVDGIRTMISALDGLADRAGSVADAMARIQIGGVNDPKQLAALRDRAFEVARMVPGRDVENVIADERALRTILGENKSLLDPLADPKKYLPAVEQAAVVLAQTQGFKGDTDRAMQTLLKALELRGGIIDPESGHISGEQFKTELSELMKTLVAGNGLIDPKDLLNVMRQAGPMARMGDASTFYDYMLALIHDLGGQRAGTGLTAAGRQIFGGRMSLAFADEMARLGLIPENSYTTTTLKNGEVRRKRDSDSYESAGAGYVELQPDTRDMLAKGLEGGLFNWVQNTLRPAMESHGYLTPTQQNQELYRIASSETFRRILSVYLGQPEQVLRDADIRHSALTPDQAISVLRENSLSYNESAASSAGHNLLAIAGGQTGLLGIKMKLLQFFTDAFNKDIDALQNGHFELQGSPSSLSVMLGRMLLKNYEQDHISLKSTGSLGKPGAPNPNTKSLLDLLYENYMRDHHALEGAGSLNDSRPSAVPKLSDMQFNLKGDVIIDGKVMGQFIAGSIAAGMNRPGIASSTFDLRATPFAASNGVTY
jgi:hypothetical protein